MNSETNEEIKVLKKRVKRIVVSFFAFLLLKMVWKIVKTVNPLYITTLDRAVYGVLVLAIFAYIAYNIFRIVQNMLKDEPFHIPDHTWIE